jgi:hypothetical protein
MGDVAPRGALFCRRCLVAVPVENRRYVGRADRLSIARKHPRT